ncbi:hypothetical protein [Pseudohongiella sp. O18]|uniref:hypothetical protein n=1 Tax=Pseudohongiella sp. O18 TaxID=2904248 RepID=UPI001F312BF1|nr:hypothetical protein [Pseudohongiella sp. O18]
MSIVRWNCFSVFFALVFLPVFSHAQGTVTADLLTDRSFIAPGGQITLVVEITNPADSGRTIERFSGVGYSATPLAESNYEFTDVSSCQQIFCPVDPTRSFPLPPGSSAQFYWQTLKVSPSAPENLLIRASNINLGLTDANDRRLNDVHLQRDFVAIVVREGQGSISQLNAQSTQNAKAGSANINASLNLAYPPTVSAGSHIEVTGTLSNHDSSEISSIFTLGSSRHLGNHVTSYNQIFCQFKCSYNGAFPLSAGESVDVLFRQMYYEADTLFSGALQILNPHAIVSDSLGRRAYVYADDIHVAVTHAGIENTPADYPPIPSREPLVRMMSDDPTPRTVIKDPNTHKYWLPLSESQGMSLSRVVAETRVGGRFEGYSVASLEEVRTLFMNHVHASQLNYPRYALFAGNQALHGVTGSLLDLVGETLDAIHVGGTTRYARGMVSELPEPGRQTVSVGIWQQNTSGSPFGVTGMFSVNSFYATQYAGMGTWLVRSSLRPGNTQALSRKDEVDFRYGQLFIASVDVDGQTYQVNFRVIDKDELILELVSIMDEYSREPAAVYDVQNLILQIPRLAYFVFPTDTVFFDVALVLVPDSNPMRFRVISAEPVDE